MRTFALAALSLAAVVSLSCKQRTYNTVKSDDSSGNSSDAKASFIGASYAETRPSSFGITDKVIAGGIARLGFAPITQCDLMAWAELSHSKLPVDPADVAEQYKKYIATGRGYSHSAFDAAANPKKKVSYAEGLEMAARYMTFQDPDPKVQAFVNGLWVSVIIEYGTGSGEGTWEGTDIKRTGGSGADATFTPEALAECRSYVPSIKNADWSCMQHMAADYLAHVIAAGDIKDSSDASRAAWSQKLATSAYAKKIPFYSILNAVPDALTPDPQKRRYEMPTVSYRTMKALSGAAAGMGKAKELQDLGMKAACYFDKNKAIDSRVSPSDKWLGYWDTGFDGSGNTVNYCKFNDAAREVGFVDQATSCNGLDVQSIDF
ncbi:MAG: hypothetical protein IOD12_14650 [Silvanigrellales bacterium]|nr:hypothetical protein [Silvanigrellales bacterium]